LKIATAITACAMKPTVKATAGVEGERLCPGLGLTEAASAAHARPARA
jgi:hypothetical protein